MHAAVSTVTVTIPQAISRHLHATQFNHGVGLRPLFAGAALGLFAAVIVRRLRRPPVGVVVKLGGSCATHKSEFEIANFTVITETAAQLARRPSTAGDAVLLHGAGSFGHFQAHKHGTSRGLAGGGWLGFCDTRGSVTLLNNHVVRALVAAGVPAVGLPPFPATRLRRRKLQDFPPLLTPVAEALNRGLVPVLHGDAVYDDDQGCAIVSGDALMVRLCDALQPDLCVFLTDVAGVYDRPPSEAGAALLPELRVGRGGALRVAARGGAGAGAEAAEIATSTAAHDVTGGLAAKLTAAAAIAARGIPVVIAQTGTEHAAAALAGERPEVGTVVMREGAGWPV